MILVVSTGVNGRWFSYGCRKLPMDQYANCGTIVWFFIEIFIWQPCMHENCSTLLIHRRHELM